MQEEIPIHTNDPQLLSTRCVRCEVLLLPETKSITPDCEHGTFCMDCWRYHVCAELLSHDGKRVKLGDRLRHLDDERVYEVSEILPSFTTGQFCIGEKVLKRGTDKSRHTLRTRLMVHV